MKIFQRSNVRFHSIITIISVLFNACNNITDNKGIYSVKDNIKTPFISTPIVYRYGYIFIQGKVNGVKGKFIIDTGSDLLLLDSTFLHFSHLYNSNLKKANFSAVGNINPEVDIITDGIYLSIGKDSSLNSYVPISDLKSVGGDDIDGLISWDFFNHRALEINYENEYIRILNKIDLPDISEYSVIPMKFLKYHFFIPLTVKVNDSIIIKGDFLIDTGSPGSILTSPVAKKNNLVKNINNKVLYYSNHGGLGEESSGFDFIADFVQISDFHFGDVTMSYSLDYSGMLANEEYAGIIGNNILERFDLIFDFINDKLYIRPNKKYSEPFDIDMLGFSYIDRVRTMGCWVVTSLYKNCSAEKNGLKNNDRIVSVNGKPVENITYEYQTDTMPYLKNITLTIIRENMTNNITIQISPVL